MKQDWSKKIRSPSLPPVTPCTCLLAITCKPGAFAQASFAPLTNFFTQSQKMPKGVA
ncbi:hypothetical protein DPMN_127839 [Dreissena polymorpha]|uniref:Uncharacterized protein n=1 Tax=Dreissena polymorpha TaxID=45954 RepID=A0A9D4JZ57_DREPO|nr:hypothetical protein DPMN_127839 [Dreissena polymorpha]